MLRVKIPILMLSLGLSFNVYSAETKGQNKSLARDLLIEKMNNIYLNLSAEDSSKVGVNLRLADLLSERARLAANDELSSGCLKCDAGIEDRKKAIVLYKEVMDQVPKENVGRVMAQVGQLSLLIGDESAAIDIFLKVMNSDLDEAIKSEAILSLADIEFKKRNFIAAEKYYHIILEKPKAEGRGLANYKLAWCRFNQGDVTEGVLLLKKQLNDPALLTRFSKSGVDHEFNAEVARDFIIFFAREKSLTLNKGINISEVEISEIMQLSPKQQVLENLELFGNELDRLGRAIDAVVVWKSVLAKQSNPISKLETQMHITRSLADSSQRVESFEFYQKALSFWGQSSCIGDSCAAIKSQIRNYLIDWNSAEKRNPSNDLIFAYERYLKVFTDDVQVAIWGSEAAKVQKKYDQSYQFLELASRSNGEHLEAVLLAKIEIAELKGDSKLKLHAYDSYLKGSTKKSKEIDVRYQQAKLNYDIGNFQVAINQFKGLLGSPEKGSEIQKLKEQAADLVLDSYVILKNDKALEEASLLYSTQFLSKEKEYFLISQKAILSQVANLSDNPELAWAALQRIDQIRLSSEIKPAYLRNKVILAEKLRKFVEARAAIEDFSSMQNISIEDSKFCLERKLWLSELALDFKGALAVTKLMPDSQIDRESKALKLAMYSDFASEDPTPFYLDFLKSSKDENKKAQVATLVIKNSKNKFVDLDKHKNYFKGNPELLAGLYLEAFGETGNLDYLLNAIKNKGVAGTPTGIVISRFLLIRRLNDQKSEFSGFKIDSSNQAKLNKSLRQRIDQVKKAELLVQEAQKLEDWTSQVIALSNLTEQFEGFYKEIIGLPLPAHLTPDQENEYLQLLSNQATPYSVKAETIKVKLKELWGNQAVIESFGKTNSLSKGLSILQAQELKSLSEVSDEDNKKFFAGLTSTLNSEAAVRKAIDRVSVEKARQQVRKNPYSIDELNRLIEIEKMSGAEQFVEYLEGRKKILQEVQ